MTLLQKGQHSPKFRFLTSGGERQNSQRLVFFVVASIMIVKGNLGESMLEQTLHLTEIEYRLLCYFLDRTNQLVSKEELLRHVWQYQWLECTSVVESSIYRLRKKIEEDPYNPRYLLTRRRQGYQLVASPFQQEPKPEK